jgi:hypothetical protein
MLTRGCPILKASEICLKGMDKEPACRINTLVVLDLLQAEVSNMINRININHIFFNPHLSSQKERGIFELMNILLSKHGRQNRFQPYPIGLRALLML